MDAGKTYFAAQKASDLHSASGNPLASLDGLLPTASTCSVLGKLQSLPRHRPANPSQNSTVARISPQGVLEQLSWSDHRVVWTLGDSIERIFDFESARQDPGPSAFNDSAHHVRQALWTKFRFEAQEPTATGTSPSVIGLSSTDTPQEKANKLFGPFAKPLAEKWSDAPSATASTTPKQNQKERILDAICVILAEELHIFFPSTGQSIVVHLPLLVQHAWPLPDTGLLLSRHLEVDEEASQPLGIDAPLPTLYALQDVYEELRFVSMRPQPILTSPTTPGSSERFTSTRTEVLLVDSATHSVVFVDRSSCRLQVCCLADVEPHPIPAPCLDDAQDNAPPSLDASMQKIGAPKRPSKSSNTMSPPPQAGPQVAGMSTAAFDRTFMDDRAHQPDNAAMPNEREDPQLHQSTFWNHFELVPLWESRDTLDL